MIPIHNLYYLLCYAWHRLPDPAEAQAVEAQEFHRPLALLTHLLLVATRRQLRRGLSVGYTEQEAELTELRGRVQLAPTLARDLLRRGRAVCTYDELGPNTPLNQLLVGTLAQLSRTRALPAATRQQVRQVLGRFPATVHPTPPTSQALLLLRRQRLQGAQAFLLHLCDLLHHCALPVPDEAGRHRFRDFRRDEVLMARLFEQFVRNFYRLEQRHYRVRSETIAWQAAADNAEDLALLPTMVTDTSLEAADRKIILDTKYYGRRPAHSPQPSAPDCAPSLPALRLPSKPACHAGPAARGRAALPRRHAGSGRALHTGRPSGARGYAGLSAALAGYCRGFTEFNILRVVTNSN
ncbi:hypothetical protein F1C16_18835 [Hymenobacter sp. NBH84]|uniref:5-methylcytosine restriction system specificity protein McrC n=1 Tax=Hymenobacter sp. NBH84 TaxID=2596915 RepID=UPI0016276946|nr:hypothetical protein [Hymenobacter sp. NBH84]QNE41471.1 hypothetical protein F1C16_18835 [Hymenobacter sp. NBH84]